MPPKTGSIWEDREVLFDLPFSYLKLRPGEKVFDRIEPIEDTKGNSGTKGRMVVTNLRIIWHSLASPRINLCKYNIGYTAPAPNSLILALNIFWVANRKAIGHITSRHDPNDQRVTINVNQKFQEISTDEASVEYKRAIGLNCILSTSTKIVNSGLRGTTQALYVLAAYKTNRYEFIFTNLFPKCVRHYTTVVGVHKAYINSRLYRDLKLRGAVVHNKQLRLLPLEKICLNEHSIWNLSNDSGNLGCLVVTNVRVVWFADTNQAFNVSMPYITIESVSIRDSKFGQALVFVARPNSGGYVLGFRADPPERLRTLYSELVMLHQAYNEKPIFGVQCNWNEQLTKPVETDNLDDLEEIGEPRGEMGSHLYIASQLSKEVEDVPPVYSPYLGLAIEPLKEGFTLKSLFEVQTTS